LKILLTANQSKSAEISYQRKLKKVEYLLEKHLDKQQRQLLIQLARLVIFPECYLIALPASLVCSLIVHFFHFIENKTAEISTRIIPASDAIERLLLINSPNAAYSVESVLAIQQKYDVSLRLLAHPLLTVHRAEHGIAFLGEGGIQDQQELFLVILIECADADLLVDIEKEVHRVLSAASQISQNVSLMHEKLAGLKSNKNLSTYHDFIAWLKDGAFLPFMYQYLLYDKNEGRNIVFKQTGEKPIGMDFADIERSDQANTQLTAMEFLQGILVRENDCIVQELSVISPILHRQPLSYIGFRVRDDDGIWGEHLFLGLFKEIELSDPACHTPALCRKLNRSLALLHLPRNSHDYAKLQELFNLIPKVELFFLGETQLHLLAQSLRGYLNRSNSIKLLFLTSPGGTQISTLIIIPQAMFNAGIEKVLQRELCKALVCTQSRSRKIILGGDYTGLQISLLPAKPENLIDVDTLENRLNRLARPWQLKFRRLLERALSKDKGVRLWQRYLGVFTSDYQALMPPHYAVKDLLFMEEVFKNSRQCVNLLKPYRNSQHYRLHFYSLEEYFLDEYLPVLENLNLRVIDQVQFSFSVSGEKIYIKSFAVKTATVQSKALIHLKPQILGAIQAIFDAKVENDELNKLVVLADMSWIEVDVLRAYRNYYFQLGFQFTLPSFHRALINNPQAAKLLYDYFEARFRPEAAWTDPATREELALFPLRLQLLDSFGQVTDINDDRILRTLFNLIDATVRSNFHVRRHLAEYFIAFKINSLGVIDMPAPRPQFEIYVHAADMQGIHLRGGKIARGGIRWSDRPDDFRTEILGLMQTQMSKNALIIPAGAKGGFVVKKIREDESHADAGKRAYIRLIRGFLDITDNCVGEKVLRPPNVVIYDDDDPYFVVAADKGTAQFPDIANAVAAEYRFWLHDAFASGGSTGYNHKALGITARGAWESVKRHFRELGKDIQNEEFTVIGIGSMDGDVFGNGMLLSRFTKLIAAFSGWHIFIDPDPDPKVSFAERQRLFELPGSTWEDYNPKLISAGGGVFRRDAKDIPISAAVRKWLGIRYRTLDGESLVRYLLTARADLLWLGGVGTYVKASAEKSEDVGDRSNDNVRVEAADLQVKVVGEGANLGFTQKARVEYSLTGGRINTDAIDNSAGVDISDHEVNLKILLVNLQKKGELDDAQQLFDAVTTSVCRSVLDSNYAQSLCLSLDQLRCSKDATTFLDLAERLEAAGLLDRAIESFPQPKVVMARSRQILARPELAVLMAACKMRLAQLLLEQQSFINSKFCESYLQAYFPEQVSGKYRNYLSSHPLANEIKAAVITNQIINQTGSTFLTLDAKIGMSNIVACVSSYLTFNQVLDADSFRQAVFALDNHVDAEIQFQLLIELENVLIDFSCWAARYDETIVPDNETIQCYGRYLHEYETYFEEHRSAENVAQYQGALDKYQDYGIPAELAQRISMISSLNDFPLMVNLSIKMSRHFTDVLRTFNNIIDYLKLKTVYKKLADFPVHDRWQRKVLNDLQENMKMTVGQLTRELLHAKVMICADYFAEAKRKQKIQRYQRLYLEAGNAPSTSLLPYIALHNELEGLL
jgi:glutamate dehydrogenase